MTEAAHHAFQFFRVSCVPADSVSSLLVCLSRAAMAEPVGRLGELYLLWLVGLAFSVSHCNNITVQLWERTAFGAL